jgi:hypothetical protein
MLQKRNEISGSIKAEFLLLDTELQASEEWLRFTGLVYHLVIHVAAYWMFSSSHVSHHFRGPSTLVFDGHRKHFVRFRSVRA